MVDDCGCHLLFSLPCIHCLFLVDLQLSWGNCLSFPRSQLLIVWVRLVSASGQQGRYLTQTHDSPIKSWPEGQFQGLFPGQKESVILILRCFFNSHKRVASLLPCSSLSLFYLSSFFSFPLLPPLSFPPFLSVSLSHLLPLFLSGMFNLNLAWTAAILPACGNEMRMKPTRDKLFWDAESGFWGFEGLDPALSVTKNLCPL